jgi:hypothetical protein
VLAWLYKQQLEATARTLPPLPSSELSEAYTIDTNRTIYTGNIQKAQEFKRTCDQSVDLPWQTSAARKSLYEQLLPLLLPVLDTSAPKKLQSCMQINRTNKTSARKHINKLTRENVFLTHRAKAIITCYRLSDYARNMFLVHIARTLRNQGPNHFCSAGSCSAQWPIACVDLCCHLRWSQTTHRNHRLSACCCTPVTFVPIRQSYDSTFCPNTYKT